MLSLNQYEYCGNNPITNVDPTGHYWANSWWNSKWFIENAINAAISLITLKPVSLLGSYLKKLSAKYLSKRAALIFSDELKRKLIAKGVSLQIASYAAYAVQATFTVLLWAINPGERIFKWLDSIDHFPNNGYFNYF